MRTPGCCVGLVLAMLWGSPATAGEREHEIEQAEKRIEMLLAEAEELQRAGRVEEAERHRREAQELREKLRAHLAERERGPRDAKELEKILAGLEHGLEALRRLGGHEEARERLELAMRDVRRELEARARRHDEREGYAQALRFAHAAMRETERGEAVELVERALHAQELKQADRRDEEAREIMERAPRPQQLARIFAEASRLYRDLNKPDRADICERWARQLKGAPDREREAAARDLEILHVAMHAMREAERNDLAERIEHAIHAYELRMAGRRDDEAMRVMRTAPDREQMIELLMFAGKLWKKFGNAERAEACVALAKRWRDHRPREDAPRDADRLREMEQRLERLERSVAEIERMLRERR
jgi:hypothetical protein